MVPYLGNNPRNLQQEPLDKPENLIAPSQLPEGSVGKVPFKFLMET